MRTVRDSSSVGRGASAMRAKMRGRALKDRVNPVEQRPATHRTRNIHSRRFHGFHSLGPFLDLPASGPKIFSARNRGGSFGQNAPTYLRVEVDGESVLAAR